MNLAHMTGSHQVDNPILLIGGILLIFGALAAAAWKLASEKVRIKK
jgi:hypothetical protein